MTIDLARHSILSIDNMFRSATRKLGWWMEKRSHFLQLVLTVVVSVFFAVSIAVMLFLFLDVTRLERRGKLHTHADTNLHVSRTSLSFSLYLLRHAQEQY